MCERMSVFLSGLWQTTEWNRKGGKRKILSSSVIVGLSPRSCSRLLYMTTFEHICGFGILFVRTRFPKSVCGFVRESCYIIGCVRRVNSLHTRTNTWQQHKLLPAQHTQNKVENEKRAEDDERDKIDPWQLIAHSILHLRRGERERERGKIEEKKRGGSMEKTEMREGGREGDKTRGGKSWRAMERGRMKSWFERWAAEVQHRKCVKERGKKKEACWLERVADKHVVAVKRWNCLICFHQLWRAREYELLQKTLFTQIIGLFQE